MSLESFAAFTVAMFALSLSPGPGVAAVVGRAIQAGLSQAILVVLGIVLGDVVYMTTAVLGWAVIAAQFGAVLSGVRLAGAVYLLYLGYKTWTAAEPAAPLTGKPAASSASSFGLGVAVTLGNPKAILFYLGFMPTFLDLATIKVLDTVLVALIILVVSLLVLGGYAVLAAGSAMRLAANPVIARRLNKVTGALMIGVGAMLALKSS